MDEWDLITEHPDWPDPRPCYESHITGFRCDGLVCSECVHNPAVWKAVSEFIDGLECGYCERTDTPCVADCVVFEYVYRCLVQEYGDPWLEGMIPDKEEGGWIAITEFDAWDVLAETDSPLGDGTALADAFCASIEHDWYQLDSEAGTWEDRLLWSWDSFEQRLLNGPRFLFSRTEAEFGEVSAKSIFSFIAELAERIDADFVKTCDTGQVLFRVRSDTRYLRTKDELGSPTLAQAKPQRMSAAGVPCFYAAEDQATAEAEITRATDKLASVGKWVTTTELTYVDLASEFELPSLFDYPESIKRPHIIFLREFITRIMRPPSNDLGDANSYLATQVLTEYLRYRIPLTDRERVDAIRYPSRANEGGTNWVIFGQPDRGKAPTVRLDAVLPATN